MLLSVLWEQGKEPYALAKLTVQWQTELCHSDNPKIPPEDKTALYSGDRYLTLNNSVSLAGNKIQEGQMQLSGRYSEDDYFSWKQWK